MSAPTKIGKAGPQSAREILAENIVILRAELNWSQEMLAFEAGLHRTFIAHVERRARNLSIDSLEKIATALRVAPHQLLVPRQKLPTGETYSR